MQIVAKIKLFISTHIEELGVSAVIIIVAFSCFYLGRASVVSPGVSSPQGITIEQVDFTQMGQGSLASVAATPALNMVQGDIVASKNGKRYYYPGCPGISRISPANIVHFASASEAEKFGLTLAANCTPNK